MMGRVGGRVSLVVTFFLMRLIGPGVLVLIGTTAVNRWFRSLRGRATAVLNVMIGMETIYPTYALFLRDHMGGWRGGFTGLALTGRSP